MGLIYGFACWDLEVLGSDLCLCGVERSGVESGGDTTGVKGVERVDVGRGKEAEKERGQKRKEQKP